jgi:predicted transcriptional regulator
MKTAISVDDVLMEQADAAARDLGLSRSRLISDALREYLKKRRRARIAEQLNRAYGDGQTAEERLLVRQMRSKLRALDPW